MEHRTVIGKSVEYIESHLQTELTADELARQAGYSVFHYYRLFQQHTGFPVMQYILRRRLLHAIYAVRSGQKRVDAALAYGFDTYAGFYRAFQREFGCTPSEYLKKKRAKRPVLMNGEENMELTHAQAREVLKHWGMENEKISDLYYESSGNRAENAVCVGDEHILKRFADKAALHKEMDLARALAGTGVQTRAAVPCQNGALYVDMGEWSYCLYRRAKGTDVVSADLYGPGSETKARFVGEIIGQLHLALKQAGADVKEADLLKTVREWALPAAKADLKLTDEFCHQFLLDFERLHPQLPRQIIHRDPNPGNILMAQDSWGMIDFDRAERNVRLFDPCYASTAILSESYEDGNEEKLQEWIVICRSLLQGYDDVAHLTESEKEAVPYVILANQFVCVAWFAQQKQYPEIYETNRKMTRWLIDHKDDLKLV